MKAVYMAIMILAGAMAIGQYANAGALEDYYTEYADGVLVQKAHKVEKRTDGGWNIYPYGDRTVGYFNTREEYCNAYDSALLAVE